MFCCSNCFTDAEIKAVIEGKKVMGSCTSVDVMTYMYTKLVKIKL